MRQKKENCMNYLERNGKMWNYQTRLCILRIASRICLYSSIYSIKQTRMKIIIKNVLISSRWYCNFSFCKAIPEKVLQTKSKHQKWHYLKLCTSGSHQVGQQFQGDTCKATFLVCRTWTYKPRSEASYLPFKV